MGALQERGFVPAPKPLTVEELEETSAPGALPPTDEGEEAAAEETAEVTLEATGEEEE